MTKQPGGVTERGLWTLWTLKPGTRPHVLATTVPCPGRAWHRGESSDLIRLGRLFFSVSQGRLCDGCAHFSR